MHRYCWNNFFIHTVKLLTNSWPDLRSLGPSAPLLCLLCLLTLCRSIQSLQVYLLCMLGLFFYIFGINRFSFLQSFDRFLHPNFSLTLWWTEIDYHFLCPLIIRAVTFSLKLTKNNPIMNNYIGNLKQETPYVYLYTKYRLGPNAPASDSSG